MKFAAGLLAALLFAAPGWGQVPPPSPPPTSIISGSTAPISASNISSNVQLPSSAAGAYIAQLYNSGSKDAFCRHGPTNSVAALTTDIRVPAGLPLAMYVGTDRYVACITSGSDTTTVDVWQANGVLQLSKSGAGSSSGVSSFNTRTGAVTLSSSDVTAALGFTPIQLSSLSGSSPISYNNSTGAISCSTCGVTGSPLSQFASTTSAQLFALLSNPTGSGGSAVFATGPTISAPTITGSLTATGLVTLGDLATQAADTLLANATGSTASPTAVSLPNCAAAADALTYNTSTHALGCNTAVNAAQLNGATFAAPGTIGGTTPGTASFSGVTMTGNIALGGNSITGLQNAVSNTNNGYELNSGACSSTAPTVSSNKGQTTSGMGCHATGTTSPNIIVGGTESVYWTSSSAMFFGGLTAGSSAQTGYACYGASNQILLESVPCPPSLEEYKNKLEPIGPDEALADVLKMRPFWGSWNQLTHPVPTDMREQPFLGARQVSAIDPRLGAYDRGKLQNIRDLSPIFAAAIQAQQRDIELLFFLIAVLAGWNVWLTLRNKK